MKRYFLTVLLLIAPTMAASAKGTSYESLFLGKEAVSPRLVVELFSPLASDNYPSLIRSVDLLAVKSNGNRLFCETQESLPDGKVVCHSDGEIWGYTFLARMAGDIYVFRTQESAEPGTYMTETYRFFHIAKTKSLDPKGFSLPSLTMTLLRDVEVPNKALSEGVLGPDKKTFRITFEGLQGGKKQVVPVTF